MKKSIIILICLLVCLSLFSGCTDNKSGNNSSTDSDNAIEIDIDTNEADDTDILSDDIDFEFKNPENAGGIEIVPKE